MKYKKMRLHKIGTSGFQKEKKCVILIRGVGGCVCVCVEIK